MFHRDDAVSYARCGPIWVMVMTAPPTTDGMLHSRPTLAAMKERHPAGFATMTYVLPSAGFKMEADARQAAADATKAYAESIRIIANVVEGSGFAAATARAVLSGLHLLTRLQPPERVFASGDEALEWIARVGPLEIADPAALGAELRQLRLELGGPIA